MDNVSLLAFSDIHGNVKSVKKMLKDVTDKTFDGILFAGDFTNAFVNGDIEEANDCYDKIMELLRSLDIPIFYVTGNRDFTIIFKENNVHLSPPKSQMIRANLPHNLENKKRIKISENLYITENKDLLDKKTIYLTHFDSYLHQNSLLQIAGHIHYGIVYRNYINLGFLYRDPAHNAPPLIGCYWEIEISNEYQVKISWYNLGKQMKEYFCKNHPFAKFYLVKYWKKCPLCFNERTNKYKIFEELL